MTEAPEDDDALLRLPKAAAMLGISRRQLMNLIYAGEIATIRIPSRVTGNAHAHRIEPAEIERFKDRNRQRATA